MILARAQSCSSSVHANPTDVTGESPCRWAGGAIPCRGAGFSINVQAQQLAILLETDTWKQGCWVSDNHQLVLRRELDWAAQVATRGNAQQCYHRGNTGRHSTLGRLLYNFMEFRLLPFTSLCSQLGRLLQWGREALGGIQPSVKLDQLHCYQESWLFGNVWCPDGQYLNVKLLGTDQILGRPSPGFGNPLGFWGFPSCSSFKPEMLN